MDEKFLYFLQYYLYAWMSKKIQSTTKSLRKSFYFQSYEDNKQSAFYCDFVKWKAIIVEI